MRRWVLLIIFGLACVGVLAGARGQTSENVDVRSGINHDEYDRLLKKYVNEQGLVNYGAWKENKADRATLDEYLKKFAGKIDSAAQSNEKAAALVNAYNGFMLRWILANYPTVSVWSLKY